MDCMMSFYINKVAPIEKVVAAISCFTELTEPFPEEPKIALLLWISKACIALNERIASERVIFYKLLVKKKVLKSI